MKFNRPLEEGIFLKRYKRFFADIEFQDQVIVAHVPNTGSMKGCKDPRAKCLFSRSDDPKRKLKFTLEMVKTPTSWVGVNTSISNKLIREAFDMKWVSHWKKYDHVQSEVKISDKSRVDFIMWKSEDFSPAKLPKKLDLQTTEFPLHVVEVKNVSLSDGHCAIFPDAVTTRGQKHIVELMDLMEFGHTCEMVYTIQRTDCDHFSPADDIDPAYGRLLRQAVKKGLKVTALTTSMSSQEIFLNKKSIPVKL